MDDAIADIPRVKDELHPRQRAMYAGPDHPVGIGDKPDYVRVAARTIFYIHGMGWITLGLRLTVRAIRRPALAAALLKVSWRFRSRNWYRQFPFLPFPDRTYTRWRLYTAYGSYNHIPSAAEIERYALWAVKDG